MARKILLADDSVTAQNMGRKILADAGYEVIAVNNGSAALKKIAEIKPDLVVLDVYMPGYSGLEVCQRLKESQETARIPVLLTVGKLEPFKPEEAQRVRAEGYIVKPFEASELLSALSKLEDKVVPRAEPSKPGRFARAIAAVDDADRSRNEPSSSETGWKSRIGFPQKKTEAEDEFSEAQPANGGSSEKSGKKEKRDKSAPAAETTVDVAAFAPIGVPKEVTPTEVAAITAAAAQIQAARNENQTSKSSASGAADEFSVNPELERFKDSSSDDIKANSAAEVRQEVEAGRHEPANIAAVSSELAAAEASHGRNGDARGEEIQDAPVTMAAATDSVASANAGSSRWTAVPVALGSDETSMSLDHEMQKAYAAFAAADYATSAGTVEAETAAQENSSPRSEAVEAQASVPSTSEPPVVPEPQPLPAEINSAETPQALEVAQPDKQSDKKIEKKSEPVAEFANPASEAQIADPAPAQQTALEPQSSVAQDASASSSAPIADNSEIKPDFEPKPDSETVKTTAAAWESWRQTRDIKSGEPEPQPQQSEPPSSVPSDTAALAVAAGAEQALQEASSAPSGDKPADVASIVDSVLADLRPKLMEEISRKMAEKK